MREKESKSQAPLVAKLARPTLRDLEPRRRLFRRLDQLRRKSSAVWIAAPAGAGKTSLLVSYLEEQSAPAFWYRIDERDHHVAELFFYLRVQAEAQEGSPLGSMELPVYSDNVDLARFSRRFFEALFTAFPPGAVLVFDDFHTASVSPQWQLAFEKCLASVTEHLNVVVLSREQPPSTLARSLAHGELGLLESNELLLNEQETVALAKRRVDKKLQLSSTELTRIHSATSGWAAGVSLLLRSSRRGRLATVSSRSDALFEYLTSAVFAELNEITQTLLLHSACLRRFALHELDELAGVSADHTELLSLYRSGFFLESDGPDEAVFRFHPLFRSFLLYRAEQVFGADGWRDVRQRAAGMLQRTGRTEEAFELFSQIDDQPSMTGLVLGLAPSLHAQGRIAMLGDWIAALEAQRIKENGWLSYWQATCLLTLEPTRSLETFEHALDAFEREHDGVGAYLSWAGAVQALVNEQRNFKLERWLDRLTKLDRFSATFASPQVGAAVVSSLLMALTLAGAERSMLEHWVGRAMKLVEETNDPGVRTMMASVLVLNYTLCGDNDQATTWLGMSNSIDDRSPAAHPGRVAARAAAAILAWHQGQAAVSLSIAKEALPLLGQQRVPFWELGMLVIAHLAALELGMEADAATLLARLSELAALGTPLEVTGCLVARASAAMWRGELKRALSLQQLALDRDRAASFAYGHGVDLHIVASLQFALGEEVEAQEALREAKQLEDSHRQPLLRYWRLMIEADRALSQDKPEPASLLLAEAFALGRAKQIYNMYLPLPARLAELCRFALAHDIEPQYARTLVQRRQLFQYAAPLELLSWPWPIKIRSFGGLEVRVEDQPLTLGRVRTPLLLLRLLLTATGKEPGLPIPRVCETLWPESDGDKATHAFDTTLMRLRDQLGEHGRRVLRVERGRVQLDPTLCWTDTAALAALLTEIDALEPETTPQPARLARVRSLADRLEALYTGPFAGEEDAASPLEAYSEQVRRKVAGAALSVRSRLAQLQDATRAEALCRRLSETDPSLKRLLETTKWAVEVARR